jgi:hypothetical protein
VILFFSFPLVLLRVAETKRKMPVRDEGEGASAGGPILGDGPVGRGSCGPVSDTLFLAPLLALVQSAWLVREAGVRGNWMLPSANADAPTSLSSLLVLGLHGIRGTTDDMSAYRAISTPRFLGERS